MVYIGLAGFFLWRHFSKIQVILQKNFESLYRIIERGTFDSIGKIIYYSWQFSKFFLNLLEHKKISMEITGNSSLLWTPEEHLAQAVWKYGKARSGVKQKFQKLLFALYNVQFHFVEKQIGATGNKKWNVCSEIWKILQFPQCSMFSCW